ncbi:hypothetical protein CXG81DRAFT_27623 [Caulochytrium protostelioides]|uniref:Uncharacterized protein n=1 Tax=Caulochytrium protostelioides TaxID=1555241 RepID=A0A4P9X3M4_9FUNG|nr:hypothetical protein CXG81DRAFT_27623 [Caulochytrium protostelioides]|eukprot:RKO99620.1 hypothetical protein CXG81DRAFT_27623 [Caulochytrium protostelioides]
MAPRVSPPSQRRQGLVQPKPRCYLAGAHATSSPAATATATATAAAAAADPASRATTASASCRMAALTHAIDQMPFMRRVTLMLPTMPGLGPAMAGLESLLAAPAASPGTVYQVRMPLSALLSPAFRALLVQAPHLAGLTPRRDLTTASSACLVGADLTLHLQKDDYASAGLAGQASPWTPAAHHVHRVRINLRDPAFVPGKSGFERVKWAFDHVLCEPWDWTLTQIPDAWRHRPSSPPATPTALDGPHDVREVPAPWTASRIHDVAQPVITADAVRRAATEPRRRRHAGKDDDDDDDGRPPPPPLTTDHPTPDDARHWALGVLDWIALARLNADAVTRLASDPPVDPYESCYALPFVATVREDVGVLTRDGITTGPQLAAWLQAITRAVMPQAPQPSTSSSPRLWTLPYLIVHAQGYRHAPVSWGGKARYNLDGTPGASSLVLLISYEADMTVTYQMVGPHDTTNF